MPEKIAAAVEPRRHAPATLRNRQPILDVLRAVLPREGSVLEIGSGSGEHAIFFAAALPRLAWQPSDVDDANLASIAAWAADTPRANLAAPIRLDAARSPWPEIAPGQFDAIVCINVIHIAPWSVCLGLMAGAGAALRPHAPLVLYGPFMRDGRHTAPSNAAFDRMLRETDPRFGVRDLGDVTAEAASNGLALESVVEMPANNLSIIFRAGGGTATSALIGADETGDDGGHIEDPDSRLKAGPNPRPRVDRQDIAKAERGDRREAEVQKFGKVRARRTGKGSRRDRLDDPVRDSPGQGQEQVGGRCAAENVEVDPLRGQYAAEDGAEREGAEGKEQAVGGQPLLHSRPSRLTTVSTAQTRPIPTAARRRRCLA